MASSVGLLCVWCGSRQVAPRAEVLKLSRLLASGCLGDFFMASLDLNKCLTVPLIK
jgi:hypothetical protein